MSVAQSYPRNRLSRVVGKKKNTILTSNDATIFARIEAAGVVKELTPDDFDKVVGGNKNVLIEFYASWCTP
eukprot:508451-Rhodomonas_salina.6